MATSRERRLKKTVFPSKVTPSHSGVKIAFDLIAHYSAALLNHSHRGTQINEKKTPCKSLCSLIKRKKKKQGVHMFQGVCTNPSVPICVHTCILVRCACMCVRVWVGCGGWRCAFTQETAQVSRMGRTLEPQSPSRESRGCI